MATSCTICGHIVGLPGFCHWIDEYRAVYTSDQGVDVTGVGHCSTQSQPLRFPIDSDRRWNDGDDERPVRVFSLPLMGDLPEDGLHGFVFHEACWSLLRAACAPTPIEPRRLYEICASLPFSVASKKLVWSHGYNGFLSHDSADTYKWHEKFSGGKSDSEFLSTAYVNPLEVLELDCTLRACAGLQPDRQSVGKQTLDCFAKLPWELLEIIAVYLDTSDALRLRRASTTFLPLSSSTKFWRSRFAASNERGYIFEKRACREATDWPKLYRKTNPEREALGLRNRFRIWRLLQPLAVLLKAKEETDSEQHTASDSWLQVGGNIRYDAAHHAWKPFHWGCISRKTVTIAVPNDLSAIAVSIVDFGSMTYVTGLRFVRENGSSTRVGYVLATEHERYIRVRTFIGFRVAVSASGLTALQAITKDKKTHPWIGEPDEVLISDRLVLNGPVGQLAVTLDGFKVVKLGVKARSDLTESLRAAQKHLFRNAAIWYPSVPPKDLILNEASFTGLYPLSTGFEPLLWTHFGGERGHSLDKVVGVKFRRASCCVFAVEIILGTADPYETIRLGGGAYDESSGCPTETIPIDGAGGERIVAVRVGLETTSDPTAPDYLRRGRVKSIKFETNYGRQIGSDNDTAPELDMLSMNYRSDNHRDDNTTALHTHSFQIAEGTTITGLYGSVVFGWGLISLGVISEVV